MLFKKQIVPKKINRITYKIFKNLLKEGFYFNGEVLRILYSTNVKNSYRFSVAVSKKMAKRAVDRNRIKRRIRVLISDYLQKNSISGVYFVVFIKSNIEDIDYKTLKTIINKDLDNYIKKINIV